MKEKMKQWMNDHPDATVEDAFEAGWLSCTDAWCHGRREQFESVCETIKEIIN